jgi:hypothetical protein
MTWPIPSACVLLVLTIGLGLRLRRPRYVGDTPHCRRCGYEVTGNQSGRCPECGNALAGTGTVLGRRARRPVLVPLTLAALAGFAVTATVAGRRVDWYAYRPDGWVVKDLASRDVTLASRAWAELSRRRDGGKLSPAADRSLTELALAAHAKPGSTGASVEGALLNHLYGLHEAGKLTPAQVDRLYQQEVRVVLRARPEVAVGDEVPVEVSVEFRTWFGKTGYRIRSIALAAPAARGRAREVARFGDPPPKLPDHVAPGDYELLAEVEVEADFRRSESSRANYAWKDKVNLVAPVRVVAPAVTDLVKWDDRPKLAPELGRAFRARLSDVPAMGGLVLELSANSPGCDFAFDAVLKVDGREHGVGAFTGKSGRSFSRYYYPKELALPVGRKVDVLLRGSQSAAKTTTDLYRIWKGDIVLENVWSGGRSRENSPGPPK